MSKRKKAARPKDDDEDDAYFDYNMVQELDPDLIVKAPHSHVSGIVTEYETLLRLPICFLIFFCYFF